MKTEAEVLRTTLFGAAFALLLIGFSTGHAQALSVDYGELHGTKWWDLNGDGVRDAAEPGLAGWQIELIDSTGLTVVTA